MSPRSSARADDSPSPAMRDMSSTRSGELDASAKSCSRLEVLDLRLGHQMPAVARPRIGTSGLTRPPS
eukprot:10998068-Karenia_brevis.AAC.1